MIEYVILVMFKMFNIFMFINWIYKTNRSITKKILLKGVL